MKSSVRLHITAGAIASMTQAQFESLQKNVVAEGLWENVTSEDDVYISGGDYLGVHLPNIFLGIEKDGYCHS